MPTPAPSAYSMSVSSFHEKRVAGSSAPSALASSMGMGRPPDRVECAAYMQALAISKGWCMLTRGGRPMDFGFTPEQEQLRVQVRRLLDKEMPLDRILAWSAN